MARYIDADLITQYFDREEWKTPDEKWWPEREIGMIVDSIPTADVVEVVHGKWDNYSITSEYSGQTYYNFKCSVCGDNHGVMWDFCPNCGAKMEVQNDNQ